MNPRYEDPPEDRDLALARRLSDGLAPDGQADDGDPVWAALSLLRASHPAPVENDERAGRLWIGIQRATRAAETSPGRGRVQHGALRLVRMPVFRFAVAASILTFVVWTVQRKEPTWSEVAVSGSSAVVFQSPDGSAITLRPNSRLEAFGSEGRTYRISGEAFFDVMHEARRPFVVEGAGAEVTVLGTRFDLSTWGGRAEVFLESGSIRIRAAATGATVDLVPGQAAAVGDSLIVETGSSEQALDWMAGSLVFSSRSVQAITDELAHHFGTELSVPESIASERLTGRVLLSDLESAVADLGIVLGGSFVPTDTGGYRFER